MAKKRKKRNKTKRVIKQKKSVNWVQDNWPKFIYLFALALFMLGYPGQNIYTRPIEGASTPLVRTFPIDIPEPAPYPINIHNAYPGDEITATGIVVLDIESGVFLFKRNEMLKLAPASTTKVLTALVALDEYSIEDVVTLETVETEGQVMGLVVGERITVENLLYGALIQSGNDAAFALADHHPKGREKFVELMNKKAHEIYMDGSTFTNPAGFDHANHKVTTIDLARLAQHALTNPTVSKMVSIPQITISDVTHSHFHHLQNVNELLGAIPGVGGIKTGWTTDAGENLITLVQRNGHKLVIVLLHSEDRFEESKQMIDWIFTHYQWKDYAAELKSQSQ
ncbi:D-alanyl-D-alanine carboxypeptidase family protein [Patescibacteria group bacterium]